MNSEPWSARHPFDPSCWESRCTVQSRVYAVGTETCMGSMHARQQRHPFAFQAPNSLHILCRPPHLICQIHVSCGFAGIIYLQHPYIDTIVHTNTNDYITMPTGPYHGYWEEFGMEQEEHWFEKKSPESLCRDTGSVGQNCSRGAKYCHLLLGRR